MIFLRRATEADLPLMMAWRNQEQVNKGFYTQTDPIVWEEHIHWSESRNKDWHIFIIMLLEGTTERPIGTCTVGQLDHWSPELGIYIGEIGSWGKGYGTEVIEKLILWLKGYVQEHRHVIGVHTTILDNNKASIRIFQKCGFKKYGKAREGESWYQMRLN